MSIPLSLPGMHGPAAGFDAPSEWLAGCHDCVRRTLALLAELASKAGRFDGAPALDAAAARFVAVHDGHLGLEDELAFPAAARLHPDPAAMGTEMAQRRGVGAGQRG